MVLASFLVIVVLCLPPMQAARVQEVAASCGNIQILLDQLTRREAEAYCQYAASEREKVERYWDATWQDPVP